MIFPIRWRIFGLLFGFGFLAYVQSKSITVAAADMMPGLHFTQFQISWIEWGFVLGYGLLQLPGGVFGQRHGARRTFVVFGVGAFIATLAMPIAPFWLHGTGLFVALLLVQLLLGCSQAGLFPVSSGVFETWFPPRWWASVQGLQTMGLSLGAALTPPLISRLMGDMGWQRALVWASLPAIPLILLWAWYGRNSPREHPSITPRELEIIGTHAGSTVDSRIDLARIMRILRDRNVVLLALSYLCMNYSFYLLSNWVFLYLVQERHFSKLESGWLATAPPLAAALGAGIGGVMTAAACQRLGNRWGYRLVPLLALPAGGALLLLAEYAASPYWALAGLATCFCVIELCEGAFWGGAMTVGRGDTMATSGVMNTGGNLGGIIGIPLVGYLTGQHLWKLAFLIGVAFAMAAAVAWLWIEVDVPGVDRGPKP
ncbi:MAG TPA: MFS transporter [Steroidobacteraceae bacterium]|jgi:ACS family glucarate transporter-like MFS transporter|nr:MFS transporter [Steroidobacteraceae bacterium]